MILSVKENLKQKLEQLPDRSGVYIMRDSSGNIIYIGKAVVLKNRVRQYFQRSQKHPKVEAMVQKVADFDYIITINEKDALILEANLIKAHRPQYNILLKDDKSAPFIRIDTKKDFPAIEITRKIKNDGAKYFGPFMAGVPVREIYDVARSAYKVRGCKNFKKGQRACLNYHIEHCLAPCEGNISKQEYAEVIKRVSAFLNGHNDEAAELIEKKMTAAAANEEFERAIIYRDRLKVLQKMKEKSVATLPKDSAMDFFAYAENGEYSVISVLFVRGGKMSGIRNFPITDIDLSGGDALESFVAQYYNSFPELPDEVYLSQLPNDISALKQMLEQKAQNRKPFVGSPQKGAKAALMRTAWENATDYLQKSTEKLKRTEQMTVGAVLELGNLLKLDLPPTRIECFDISNISGTDKVASMVVFKDGVADKKSYRRFKIKTVEGADDFASMREVISRRLAKLGNTAFGQAPSLIVVDGGKGQLSSALSALESSFSEFDNADQRSSLSNIKMIGLAKEIEEIILPDSSTLFLKRDSAALKLLMRIRDEAHRFAITYHRTVRQKNYQSELLRIEGVGSKKAASLLIHFRDYSKIKNASVDELACAPQIDKKTAQRIYDYFHNQ